MKKKLFLLVFMIGLSLEGVDRAEWKSFVSADRAYREDFSIRANNLQTRIDQFSKDIDDLHRNVTTINARIEFGSKVVKVVAACGVVALGGFLVQHFSKKRRYAQLKKYKKKKLQECAQHQGVLQEVRKERT
jgi:hypothetical protein